MLECMLPTFDALTNKQVQQINENSLIVKYRKGDVICYEGHPISHVLFLRSGLVKLHKRYQQDNSMIIGIIGANRFFGLTTGLTSSIFQISVSALDDCEVVHTDFSVFKGILFKNGKYTCNLLIQISEYSLLLMRRMTSNTYKQVPGRLAELLLFFAKEVYNSNSYNLPLSRQEIAEFIASTKESVSRTLSDFKNDNLIEIDDKFVTLKSIELFEKFSRMG
jgi:CRP-like cAMP-binding protein